MRSQKLIITKFTALPALLSKATMLTEMSIVTHVLPYIALVIFEHHGITDKTFPELRGVVDGMLLAGISLCFVVREDMTSAHHAGIFVHVESVRVKSARRHGTVDTEEYGSSGRKDRVGYGTASTELERGWRRQNSEG